MKKSVIIATCGVLLLTSCGSTAGEGAFNGAMLGGWFGSAIGGIIGGHYGHDVGTVVGMATGAVIGAQNGAEEEERRIEAYEEARRERVQRHRGHRHRGIERRGNVDRRYDDDYDSGFDSTNSGDDRIEFESSVAESQSTVFELKNLHFTDANNDGILQRSEVGRISFEIKNVTSQIQYDLIPAVVESSGNSHILISPSAHIENIAPGQTLRYTAMVAADGSLKDGKATFEISVSLDGRVQGKELLIEVPTSKTKNQK
jgi:hypothetical protein